MSKASSALTPSPTRSPFSSATRLDSDSNYETSREINTNCVLCFLAAHFVVCWLCSRRSLWKTLPLVVQNRACTDPCPPPQYKFAGHTAPPHPFCSISQQSPREKCRKFLADFLSNQSLRTTLAVADSLAKPSLLPGRATELDEPLLDSLLLKERRSPSLAGMLKLLRSVLCSLVF